MKHWFEYVGAAIIIALAVVAGLLVVWVGVGVIHDVYLPDVKPPHAGQVGALITGVMAMTLFVRLAWNLGSKD